VHDVLVRKKTAYQINKVYINWCLQTWFRYSKCFKYFHFIAKVFTLTNLDKWFNFRAVL